MAEKSTYSFGMGNTAKREPFVKIMVGRKGVGKSFPMIPKKFSEFTIKAIFRKHGSLLFQKDKEYELIVTIYTNGNVQIVEKEELSTIPYPNEKKFWESWTTEEKIAKEIHDSLSGITMGDEQAE